MDLKANAILIAPSVKNCSCAHPRYAGQLINHIGLNEGLQGIIVLCLTLGIIGANLLVILVINSRRYTAYIHPQVIYLLYHEIEQF